MAEIQIEFDVAAQMRDDTALHADVYRPRGTGPWPVLLSRLPYGKQTPMMAAVLDPLAAARRGCMVVLQDTRGRFASEGVPAQARRRQQRRRGSGAGPGKVLLFVMGINQWREETEWPLSRAVATDFHLRADGRLTQEAPSTAEQPEEFRYDPVYPVSTTGGALCMTDEFRPGPLDQRGVEEREDVLVFTTEPLTEDVEVTGRIRAVLFAATDGLSTDWVARLCDVDENGVSRNVADGIVRVQVTPGDENGVSRNVADGIVRVQVTPGEAAEHVIDLWSTSIAFRAGHRLRVQITSSNFPRWDRNLTRANPRRARPRAEWPTSRSSMIPPSPPASSYRWFRSGRKRGRPPRATCTASSRPWRPLPRPQPRSRTARTGDAAQY
ncbi:CocE/NonD family hydrolase [Streptomyces sp. NPDC087903]|uniref:CocE/NonD family hydrolase n=1 Tax=Streptomyces sp. NPDC087903 TaxID=3365819 RepID=UPI00382FA575